MTQPLGGTNQGGYQTYVCYSGSAVLNDQPITSGTGRINQILPHTLLASGLPVTFYDSAVATSGGPFAASGHKPVGLLPPGSQPNILNVPVGQGVPFFSGLCVATKSGQPGFTVCYSLEKPQY